MQGLLRCALFGLPGLAVTGRAARSGYGVAVCWRRYNGRQYGVVAGAGGVAVEQWTRSAMSSSGRCETKRVGSRLWGGRGMQCFVFHPFLWSDAKGMYRQAVASESECGKETRSKAPVTSVDVDKDRLGRVAKQRRGEGLGVGRGEDVESGGRPVGKERN